MIFIIKQISWWLKSFVAIVHIDAKLLHALPYFKNETNKSVYIS